MTDNEGYIFIFLFVLRLWWFRLGVFAVVGFFSSTRVSGLRIYREEKKKEERKDGIDEGRIYLCGPLVFRFAAAAAVS